MTPKELEQILQKEYLNIADFAKAAGYSRNWIYKLINEGKILTITPFRGQSLIPVSYLKQIKRTRS